MLDPTIAGATNLNRLSNTLGMSASVPLYRAQAGLELDYTYSDILGGGGPGGSGVGGGGTASQQTAIIKNSLHVGGNFGFEIAPSLTLGVEVNASHNTGAGSFDTNVISGGGFLRGQLTRLIEVDTGAGILIGEGPGVDQPQYYVYLSARHEVSRNLALLLGISRDIEFSSGEGVALNNDFHIAAQLRASRRWTVGASPFVKFWGCEHRYATRALYPVRGDRRFVIPVEWAHQHRFKLSIREARGRRVVGQWRRVVGQLYPKSLRFRRYI